LGEAWHCITTHGWSICSQASDLADEALEQAQELFPGESHNGRGDAWRHCYWSCRMEQTLPHYIHWFNSMPFFTYPIEIDPAYEIGKYHEDNDTNQPQIEYDMDTHNNDIGLSIGKKKCKDCADECTKALGDGRLLCIVNDELVPCNQIKKE
jgi:hypothetical protein